MTTIILVRHGENEWVKRHRLAGWIEGVHLNATGHQQAAAAAERLAQMPVKAVYSSPVTRCMETAVYIADTFKLPIQELEPVGEVRYGDWEGEKISKLSKDPLWRIVQFFPSRMRFPNGETMREVQARGVNALETLAANHPQETIVVVSHADVIKLIMAHYLGIHIDLFQRMGLAPASVSVIDLSESGMVRILRLNDNGPLTAPPAPPPNPKKKKSKKKHKKKNKQHGASN